LIVNGSTSGPSFVHIDKAIGSQGGQTIGDGIQIVSVPNGVNDGTFTLNNRVVAGAYDYSLLDIPSGPDAGLYLQSHPSPEVEGALSVAASQQYLELASLDSLVQREGELEASYQEETNATWVESKSRDPKDMDSKAMVRHTEAPYYKTSEVWTRGIYRNDDLHTSVGLRQDSGVGQVGGDYQFRGLAGNNDRLYLGALADYGQSSGHTTIQNVHIDGSDIGFGAYATYLNGGFYSDAVVKGNFSHETVKTQFGNFGASGSGVSASLEAGYAFNVGCGVKVEPQAQFVYENESYNHPTDDLGRVYDLHNPDFLLARWGVRVDKSFEYSPGLHITPYLRVNGLDQIVGDNKVTVAGTDFNEDITGLSVAVDGGVTADVCQNVALYINGNSAWGEKDDSYGATGGVKISW
jgi:outer membrane autotransporter protein